MNKCESCQFCKIWCSYCKEIVPVSDLIKHRQQDEDRRKAMAQMEEERQAMGIPNDSGRPRRAPWAMDGRQRSESEL